MFILTVANVNFRVVQTSKNLPYSGRIKTLDRTPSNHIATGYNLSII